MRCQKRTDTTCGNSLVGQLEIKRRQEKHREALSKIKPTLSIQQPPAPQPHLTLYGRDYAVKKKATTEAAFADLKMIQAIARTMTRPVKQPERQGPMSLNTEARKAEITRIMDDNHRLLNQIESVTPFCRTTDLVSEHREQQKYVINASHTKRLVREYDNDLRRIKEENDSKYDRQRRATAKRRDLTMAKRSGGTVSLPALMPAEARSSPSPTSDKPMAASSSSSMARASASSDTAFKARRETTAAQRGSSVTFSSTGDQDQQDDVEGAAMPKTPYPAEGRAMGSQEEDSAWPQAAEAQADADAEAEEEESRKAMAREALANVLGAGEDQDPAAEPAPAGETAGPAPAEPAPAAEEAAAPAAAAAAPPEAPPEAAPAEPLPEGPAKQDPPGGGPEEPASAAERAAEEQDESYADDFAEEPADLSTS